MNSLYQPTAKGTEGRATTQGQSITEEKATSAWFAQPVDLKTHQKLVGMHIYNLQEKSFSFQHCKWQSLRHTEVTQDYDNNNNNNRVSEDVYPGTGPEDLESVSDNHKLIYSSPKVRSVLHMIFLSLKEVK